MSSTRSESSWQPEDLQHAQDAKSRLHVWPLDEYNAELLDQVHPRDYTSSTQEPHEVYDLIAIGAGAGGLVSSKQSARRGAKSAMITERLAGGDCLNVGCVPSKAILRAARAVAAVRRAADFGIVVAAKVEVDFGAIMGRLRRLRAQISPADGHAGTAGTGAHVFQGRGRFVNGSTIEVNGIHLTFRKAVVCTGGRPSVPDIPGLAEAPYTTNEKLFNLETLPPRMVILGAGVIALEMAQAFATFGSKVTVLQRSSRLFQSKGGDAEAGELLQNVLERHGVTFVTGSTREVTTLREKDESDTLAWPLMSVQVTTESGIVDFECECLLVATGRTANVEDLGLDNANVPHQLGKGILVNDFGQSIGNPNVYAVGDCVAGVPRLTHMSGEMAKLIVQNSLFNDQWKLSSLVVPAVMYTDPEYATVGISSQELADRGGVAVDVYRAGLEHNDRAILEGSNEGFCKILCKAGTDEVVGATIVAERAGEMINEVSLAIKYGIGLKAIGRNIHPYPTTGEAVMGCGIQYINSHWETLHD